MYSTRVLYLCICRADRINLDLDLDVCTVLNWDFLKNWSRQTLCRDGVVSQTLVLQTAVQYIFDRPGQHQG